MVLRGPLRPSPRLRRGFNSRLSLTGVLVAGLDSEELAASCPWQEEGWAMRSQESRQPQGGLPGGVVRLARPLGEQLSGW